MLFANFLTMFFKEGAIRLIDSRGKIFLIGDGSDPQCTIRLHKWHLKYSLAINPTLLIPEAYTNGTLSIEDGNLYEFLNLAGKNFRLLEKSRLFRYLRNIGTASFGQYNPIKKAKLNVAHHYDLSKELYDMFLDSDRQYSCAYFLDKNSDLEAAQLQKKRHLASKLRLTQGLKILDIGSGWGGLALYLSKVSKVNVTGLTLSEEQYLISKQRAEEENLSNSVRFELKDYRNENNQFDRIVSVGMFEHVGKKNYKEFFRKINDLLVDDGIMVLHFIGRVDAPHAINPFIQKYIFPGADLPSLSEVMKMIEPTSLIVTDIEILRTHYAKTLRLWRKRFTANWQKVAEIYDERFCRMWEMYLSLCEVGFRHFGLVVFQMQITKNMDSVPLTRDYMIDWERKQVDQNSNHDFSAA